MESPPNPPLATTGIDGLLAEMRPELHRYCARMVGSVIDGEDVLQDALIKAVELFASAGAIGNPRGMAVPDRAQHRAGFSAPAQPPASIPVGRGGGHDCRPGRSATMKGVRYCMSPLMKCTSRLRRSSFATRTGVLSLRAALSAAASLGRRSKASAPLPVSVSENVSMIVKPSAFAKRSSASCCASRPKPDRPCPLVLTRI